MILDELFGPPVVTVKAIVRKDGTLKTVVKPATNVQPITPEKTTFFPISKERK